MKSKEILKLFFVLQLLSFTQMSMSQRLNGDFYFEPFYVNTGILAFFLSSLPFVLLYIILRQKENQLQIDAKNLFFHPTVVIVLLITNILFALILGVGLYSSQDIYQVPIILKPIFVIINRIDVYVVFAFIAFNDQISRWKQVLTFTLLFIFSISKGSLFIVLFGLIILVAKGIIKVNFRNIIISILFMSFSIGMIMKIYEWRENRRKGESIDYLSLIGEDEIKDYFSSRVVGRVSSLSATTYYLDNYKQLAKRSLTLSPFEYAIEMFRPIYGGIIRNNNRGYTPFLTSIYDDQAGTEYGLMYGLPIVLLLSYFQGVHVLFLNVFLLFLIIYLIFLASKITFGKNYVIIYYTLIYYPLSSGVPSELVQILISIMVIYTLNIFYRYFVNFKLS